MAKELGYLTSYIYWIRVYYQFIFFYFFPDGDGLQINIDSEEHRSWNNIQVKI